MLKAGNKVPSFELNDKDNKAFSLSDVKTDLLAVFFYPKDNTPGCTIESKSFSDHLADFKKLKCTVFGISGGDAKSKTKFCEKNDLKSIMLSDTDFSVAQKFGVYGEKSFMGKKYLGINRVTFIIKNKKIIKVYDKVKPNEHVAEVLEYLKTLD